MRIVKIITGVRSVLSVKCTTERPLTLLSYVLENLNSKACISTEAVSVLIQSLAVVFLNRIELVWIVNRSVQVCLIPVRVEQQVAKGGGNRCHVDGTDIQWIE